MSERIFNIAHFADQGVLLLLVALSLASMGMIIERWKVLRHAVGASLRHRQILEEAWKARDWSRIEKVAQDPVSLEGRATAYGLDHVRRHGVEGLEEAFEAISLMERPKLERSLGFLATVGSNAPYIGLFGTVLGIMKAFRDMAQAGDAGQQSVMAGISSALIATAAGLMVAIPAVLAFNYFQKQVKTVMSSLDSCREVLIGWAKQEGGSLHGRTNEQG